MEKYCADHPEYQPRVVKTFLSKAEQRIKDKVDGKPEKPPRYFAETGFFALHLTRSSSGSQQTVTLQEIVG